MRSKRAWTFVGLLLGACAIPNIEIDDSRGGGGGGGSSGSDNRGGSEPGSIGGRKGGQAGDDGIEPISGGEPAVGGMPTTTPGGGGTDSTGGTSSPSGGSTTEPKPAKLAVGKFCNAVVVGGVPVALDLRIGSGDNLVHIVADSGTCAPVVGRACVPITTGSSVPIGVYDLDGEAYFQASTRIEPGDAWIFAFYYDELNEAAQLGGKSDIDAEACSAIDFDDLYGAP